MSVTRDILATYRAPRAVYRRRVGTAPREDRALAVAILACGLIFIGQWPRLVRQAQLSGEELNPLLGGALFAWLFIMPLMLYALGTLSHLAARALGGRGSGYRARFALFWALLAAAPLWLGWGVLAGLAGPGPLLQGVGALALAAFLAFWALGFREAEWGI